MVGFSPVNRTLTITASVALLHLGGLWALQTGLLHRMIDMVTPAEILVEVMAPQPTLPNAAQPRQPSPAPAVAAPPIPPKTAVVAAATPVPLAIADTSPEPPSARAPAAASTASALPTATVSTPEGPATVTTAAGTPATKVELPSSDADYLNNPKPPYPPLSRRLAEQGKVVVRTFIGADGIPQKAEIKQSSGFDRLDQAALNTAMRWRYVPGKRGGIAEAMWFNIPLNFVLE